MKKSIKNLAAFLLAGVVLCITGCKTDAEVPTDTTPPAKVTVADNVIIAANGLDKLK